LADDRILCEPPKWRLLLIRDCSTMCATLVNRTTSGADFAKKEKRTNARILADLQISEYESFHVARGIEGCHEFAKIQLHKLHHYVSDDRPCLAFVISNVLRIGSQSILRLIERLNPPRSRRRPFLEYLYAINSCSTSELVANYVNGLDRGASTTRFKTIFSIQTRISIISCNQSTRITWRLKSPKRLSQIHVPPDMN